MAPGPYHWIYLNEQHWRLMFIYFFNSPFNFSFFFKTINNSGQTQSNLHCELVKSNPRYRYPIWSLAIWYNYSSRKHYKLSYEVWYEHAQLYSAEGWVSCYPIVDRSTYYLLLAQGTKRYPFKNGNLIEFGRCCLYFFLQNNKNLKVFFI